MYANKNYFFIKSILIHFIFTDVFKLGKADAALAASIFHFGEIPVPELKCYLKEKGVEIRY